MCRECQEWAQVWVGPQIPCKTYFSNCSLKSIVMRIGTRNVAHTANSSLRLAKYSFHATMIASRIFVRWGMSLSRRSSRSKRIKSRNSRHSITLRDYDNRSDKRRFTLKTTYLVVNHDKFDKGTKEALDAKRQPGGISWEDWWAPVALFLGKSSSR
jgi:hypothetical protein